MRIQKKIVRLITFKPYSEHTETIFKNLEILNVYQINDFLTSTVHVSIVQLKKFREIFTNYFVTNNEVHHHNTRKTSKLHKSYNRTNYAKHTLSNSGVDIWNGLANKYKDIRSLYTFKRELKKYFLLKNKIIYS
jgi:hypothetical protein